MKFPDHLWLPFIGHPQSDTVVFSIVDFNTFKYLVTQREFGISIHYMVTSNESSKNYSMSIVELTNKDELSREYGVVIFIT